MADPVADTLVAPVPPDTPAIETPSLSAPSIDPSLAAPPTIGGRYEILGLLGAGGMGNVYRARDTELDEVVALKVLRPEIAGTPGVIDRFRREVKLARRVTHPNVARVFDLGEAAGEKFLTMELVDGEPLSAALARDGRMSARRVAELAAGICAGLGAAHAAGVIHRDLKPDNVMLARDGRVVVTDFGIARAVTSGESHTVAGFVGTPAYMAPEQVEAGATVDARADLYALGAMLYELATGERPWQGDSVLAVACARLLKPPPDPRAIRPDLPPPFAAVVLRCMARSPGDRYASAADVAAALATAMADVATPVPGPGSSLTGAMPRDAIPRDAGVKHVAVLPFRNAGAPEHAYIAEGLTEDLIDLLSMAQGLRVRSRGVVMRYQDSARDPREVGRELDVQVVVEGSVRRGAGVVRIGARLVSVADGVQLWARRFDRPEADLLAVSDDAARAIAEALTVELAAPERRSPDDPEALDLYLRARAKYHAFGAIHTDQALQLFEQALARAPDDPRILAGHAMARARRWNVDPEAVRGARAAAERAVLLGPGLPEAHVALATVRFMCCEEASAIAPLRRAIRLAPSNAEAHDLLGRALCETTHLGPGIRHLEIALSIEPGLDLARFSLARCHALRADWDRADRTLAALAESAALPAMSRILLWHPDAARAAALIPTEVPEKGPLATARALLQMIVDGTPAYPYLPSVADPSRLPPRLRAFFPQLEAEVAGYLGEYDRAIAAIERADTEGFADVAWMDGCPLFAGIRGDPRFAAVRGRIAPRAEKVVAAYVAVEIGA